MAEKKEKPKAEGEFKLKVPGISGKVDGLGSKAFGLVKFILGVCLLPFVYSASASFLREFSLIEKVSDLHFCLGVMSFLVIYLFIWEPAVVYTKGQRLLEVIFGFIKPLVKVAPYLLPIYTIIIFILYRLLSGVAKTGGLLKYSIFALGFTFMLHLVFSAKTMQAKKGDFLRANYIFGFSFIYIINILLLSFGLNLIFKEFSFVNFFNQSSLAAKNILSVTVKQLFLR